MSAIEIDFDVFKAITAKRKSEHITENDVLRDLLGLPPKSVAAETAPNTYTRAWVTKGVTFPEGTEFRANYKGQTYLGRVEASGLVLDGKRYPSPSAAANSVTGGPVNGWRFWKARLPGQPDWKPIELMRKPGL